MINAFNKSNASTLVGEFMSNTGDSPSPCDFICHMCGWSYTSITENLPRPSDCTMVSEYRTSPFHEFPKLDSLQSYLASRENMNGESGTNHFSNVEKSLPFYFAVLCKVCYNVIEKMRITQKCQKDYSVEGSSGEAKNSTVELLEPATEVTQEQLKMKPNKRRRYTRLHRIEVVDHNDKNYQLERSTILTRSRAITETSKKLNSFPARRSLRLNKSPRINYSETVTKFSRHQNNFKPSGESLIVTDFLEIDLTEHSNDANNSNSTTDGEQKSDSCSNVSFPNNFPINAEDALNIDQTKSRIDTAISANDNLTMDTSMQEDSNRELDISFEFVGVDEKRQNPHEFYPREFVQEEKDPLRSQTAVVPFQGDILPIVEPACSSNGVSSTVDTDPLAIVRSVDDPPSLPEPVGIYDLDENNESISAINLPVDENTSMDCEPSLTRCIKDTFSKKQNLEGTWDLIHSDDGDDDGPACQKMQELSHCGASLNELRNIEQLLGCSENSTDKQNVNDSSSSKCFLNKMLTKIDETLEQSFQPSSFNDIDSVKSSVTIQNFDLQPSKNADYSHPLESTSCKAGMPTSTNDESTAQRESIEQIQEDCETANECEGSHPLPASLPNSVVTEFSSETNRLLSESEPIVGQYSCSSTSSSLESNTFDNPECVGDTCNLECPDDVVSLSPPSLSPVSDKAHHEYPHRGSPHPFADFDNSSSRRSAIVWALSDELDELDGVFFSDDSQM